MKESIRAKPWSQSREFIVSNNPLLGKRLSVTSSEINSLRSTGLLAALFLKDDLCTDMCELTLTSEFLVGKYVLTYSGKRYVGSLEQIFCCVSRNVLFLVEERCMYQSVFV